MNNQPSEPKVVGDKNGYYVARTVFLERQNIEVPFIRLSDYYGNPHMANKCLAILRSKGAFE